MERFDRSELAYIEGGEEEQTLPLGQGEESLRELFSWPAGMPWRLRPTAWCWSTCGVPGRRFFSKGTPMTVGNERAVPQKLMFPEKFACSH